MATQVKSRPAAAGKQEAFIANQLARAQGRVRWLDLATALFTFLAGLLLFAVSMVLLDARFVLSPATRQAAFLLAAAAGVAYLVWAVVIPLRYRVNPHFAARQLEGTLGASRNHVINWVDLHEQDVPAALRTTLTQRAAKDVSRADLEAAFNNRPTYLAGGAAAALGVAFFALVFILGPRPFGSLLGRALAPFGNPGAIATRTQIHLLRPASGDVLLTRGSQLTVIAEVGGRVPDVRDDDAPHILFRRNQQERFRKRALQPDDSRREWAVKFLPDEIGEGMWYKVTAGDAETPEYQVRTRPLPLISDFQAVYRFRPYVGRADRSQTHRALKELRGTTVLIRAGTNRDVKKASLEFEGVDGRGDVLRSEVRPGEPQAMHFSLVLDKPGRYRLRYTSTDGESYLDPLPADIHVLPDLPPTVKVTAPAKDVSLHPNGHLALQGEAKDDIGVAGLVLRLQFAGGEKFQPQPYMADKLGKPGVGTPRELSYRDLLELGTLKDAQGQPVQLQPGQVIEYWLEASDACDYPRANVTASEPRYKITIVEPPPMRDPEQEKKDREAARKKQEEERKQQEEQLRKEQAEREEKRQREQKQEQEEQRKRDEQRNQQGDKPDEKKDQDRGQGEQKPPDRKDEPKNGENKPGEGGQGEKKDQDLKDKEKALKDAIERKEKGEQGQNEDKERKDQGQEQGEAKKDGQPKPGEGKAGGENKEQKNDAKPGQKKDGGEQGQQAGGEKKDGDNKPGDQGQQGGAQPDKKPDNGKPDAGGKKGEGKEGAKPDQGGQPGEKKPGEGKQGANAKPNKPGEGKPGDDKAQGGEQKPGGEMKPGDKARQGQARDGDQAGKPAGDAAPGQGKDGAQPEKAGEGKPGAEQNARPDQKPGEGKPAGAQKGPNDKPDGGEAKPGQAKGAGENKQPAGGEPKGGKPEGAQGNKPAPENAKPDDVRRMAKDLENKDAGRREQAMRDLKDVQQKAKDPAARQEAEKALAGKDQGQPGQPKAGQDGKPGQPKDGGQPGKAGEQGGAQGREAGQGGQPGEGKPGAKPGEKPDGQPKPGEGKPGDQKGEKGEGKPGEKKGGDQPQGEKKGGEGQGAGEGQQGGAQPMGQGDGAGKPGEGKDGAQPGQGGQAGQAKEPGRAGQTAGEGGTGERGPPPPGGDPTAKPVQRDPAARARASQLQLEELRKKVTPDILKDAKMTPEEYQKFLRDYEELVRRQQKAADEVKDVPPAPGRTGTLPSMGGRAIKRGDKQGDLRNEGRPKPPPEYRDSYREFLRLIQQGK